MLSLLLLPQCIMGLKFLPPAYGVKPTTAVMTTSSSTSRPAASATLPSSSLLTSVPSSHAQTQLAGRKRKRSRWSSAQGPSAEELAIAEAMASFSESPSTSSCSSSQQQLTAEQQRQLKEQVEVSELVRAQSPILLNEERHAFCGKVTPWNFRCLRVQQIYM